MYHMPKDPSKPQNIVTPFTVIPEVELKARTWKGISKDRKK